MPGGGRGAFTLIEVLIAVVVLSTGIVLVLQGLHGILTVWEAAVDRMRSVMLAREQMTEVLLSVTDGEAPEAGAGGAGQYLWRVEVEPRRMPGTATAAGGQLHAVRCVVRRDGGVREYTLATLVYVPAPAEEGPAQTGGLP